MEPTTCDILVTNGFVVTMDAARRTFSRGAVAVGGRRIIAVGPEREILARYRGRQSFDAHGAAVHPGFIEPHLHIVHGTGRGIFGNPAIAAQQPASFPDWKAGVTPDDEKVATELGALEMLRHGFTMFIEPGTVFDGDAVAAGAEAVGVRALLSGPYLWDHVEAMKYAGGLESPALYERAPPLLDRCLAQLDRELHRNADPDALVRGYVTVYGMATASDELLLAAKSCADAAGVVFHQHENYTRDGTLADREQLGRSRVAHLAELGVLGPNTTLVHMNLMFEDDIPIILASRTNLVWCPISTLRFGYPAGLKCWMPELHARGACVALALDGPLDAPLGTAARLAMLTAAGLDAPLGPEAILEMQTIRGAVASGMQDAIGSLEVGKRADIVIRRDDAIELYPGTNTPHGIALTAEAGSVATVIVDGTVVLDGGVSTRVDEQEVMARGKESVLRRLAALGLSPGLAWPVTA